MPAGFPSVTVEVPAADVEAVQGALAEDDEALEVTVADIRALLASGAEQPVLYVKRGPDNEGGDLELDVWAAALVDHRAVVITREEVEDILAGDTSAEAIREALDSIQEQVDQVAPTLADA